MRNRIITFFFFLVFLPKILFMLILVELYLTNLCILFKVNSICNLYVYNVSVCHNSPPLKKSPYVSGTD